MFDDNCKTVKTKRDCLLAIANPLSDWLDCICNEPSKTAVAKQWPSCLASCR